jgi:hypothetical protein
MTVILKRYLTIPSDRGTLHEATFTQYSGDPPSQRKDYTQTELSLETFNFRYSIKRIELWKVPIFEWLPTDLGFLYHTYVVFQTEEQDRAMYWSFEKTWDQKLEFQKSGDKRDVIDRVSGKPRLLRRYWSPQRITHVEDISTNMIQMKHMFYETPKYSRVSFLDSKYFAQDAFNLMCPHNESYFETGRVKAYLLESVKTVLKYPLNFYIHATVFFFCYYNLNLFVAAYWTLIVKLSPIELFANKPETLILRENRIKSRFTKVYDYE